MSHSVIILCHGSTDPRYQRAFTDFVHHCQQALHPIPVHAGQLEQPERPLVHQLQQAFDPQDPDPLLIVVPIFMGGGIHLNQDIPTALATVSQHSPQLTIRTTPALGQVSEMADVVEERLRQDPTVEGWILISHGSRQPEFGRHMERLAAQVRQRIPSTTLALAYWSHPPSLLDQVHQLYAQGIRQLQVLPFFFFPGGILEQLQAQLMSIKPQCPDLRVSLGDLLLPDPLLTEAVIRLVHDSLSGLGVE